ncbi:unnamed protein product (macronuclear) [Paramecium tetraurelia]|uniref:Transmembrane protein n=1 Tax=Paramecium tetraurelia TaxID=5888 RepID=A0DRF9_PARTE|nr:uncharacterized protein GSPATT00019343001 [Paramecium tetraurelia]CAK85626.1 unnamed protein product [Paramecium tetraurelia]|eukprot:XP_001453023.1 hypothetical protein (macronuclear) [Paramecium tetraurelia strain d4-2]
MHQNHIGENTNISIQTYSDQNNFDNNIIAMSISKQKPYDEQNAQLLRIQKVACWNCFKLLIKDLIKVQCNEFCNLDCYKNYKNLYHAQCVNCNQSFDIKNGIMLNRCNFCREKCSEKYNFQIMKIEMKISKNNSQSLKVAKQKKKHTVKKKLLIQILIEIILIYIKLQFLIIEISSINHLKIIDLNHNSKYHLYYQFLIQLLLLLISSFELYCTQWYFYQTNSNSIKKQIYIYQIIYIHKDIIILLYSLYSLQQKKWYFNFRRDFGQNISVKDQNLKVLIFKLQIIEFQSVYLFWILLLQFVNSLNLNQIGLCVQVNLFCLHLMSRKIQQIEHKTF